jgi:Zn-dependent peptidase ImmA (M78 family)
MTEEEKLIYNKYKKSMPFKVVEFSNEIGVPILLDKEMDIDETGFIEFDDNRYYIVINKKESEERNRFIIAHKLGYYFYNKEYLKEHGTIKDSYPVTIYDPIVCKMCGNAFNFAAGLLVPEYIFKKKYSDKEIDLDLYNCNKSLLVQLMRHRTEKIKKLAKYFNVPTSIIEYVIIQLYPFQTF